MLGVVTGRWRRPFDLPTRGITRSDAVPTPSGRGVTPRPITLGRFIVVVVVGVFQLLQLLRQSHLATSGVVVTPLQLTVALLSGSFGSCADGCTVFVNGVTATGTRLRLTLRPPPLVATFASTAAATAASASATSEALEFLLGPV